MREGQRSPEGRQALSVTEVADHVERFQAVYRNALNDPSRQGVFDVLVRHFADHARTAISERSQPDRPTAGREIAVRFLAHGFAGAVQAWLADPAAEKADLIQAAVACAPTRWR